MSRVPHNVQPQSRFRSSLARCVGRTPAGAAELWAMRRRAWRESGMLVLRPDEIADAFARQTLIDAAQALFGERPLQVDRKKQP